MLTLVGVDVLITGRMEFRLKTGVRASSKDGGSGREQFSMTELHGATEEKKNVIMTVKKHLTVSVFPSISQMHEFQKP